MYSGEYDACDVTLSVYPQRASLKNMPDEIINSPAKFANFVLYYPRENPPQLERKWCIFSCVIQINYKIWKFCRVIFSSFYNVSRPNFAILLILTCSF